MPDSNLNTSIAAMRTSILNDLPTATVDELVDLSRAAKSLNLGNDSTVETAINNRSVALINGGATQAQIIQISRAVKSVLSPSTFANNIANITTITSALIPDTDVTYDLGSPSNRFNDLYLDGNTIDLGGHTIKATATGIEVPEITIGSGTNKVKLSANSSGKLEQVGTNSGGVVQDTVTGSGPASTAVTNLSDLTAIASPATGQSVLVTSTNKLYIYNGTGWYLIAEVTNLSPTAITGLNATYDLAIDGTATTITLNSTDPEGATLTWSHAITTGTLGSTATITNVNNVFTITPSTTTSDAGSFSITFSASDGSQAATSVSAFTLAFFNISNATYAMQSPSVFSQEPHPYGFTFNPNGTRMFVGGDGGYVYQYNLSTAFNTSTASYANKSFNVRTQVYRVFGIRFNNAGTSMYIVFQDGGASWSNQVFQYTLSTAFDVSTAYYSNKVFSVLSQESQSRGLEFSNDGTSMYLSGNTTRQIHQYTLSTAFDVSTASYANKSLSWGSQDTTSRGIGLSHDGKHVFVMADDDVIYQYNLSTAFDVSTGSYSGLSLNVSTQDLNALDVQFNDDTSKMYVLGRSNDRVYQFNVQ